MKVLLLALSLASALGATASAAPAVAATEFGAPQGGVAIGITSRSVPSAGGPHVLVQITTKNTGSVPLALAPIVEVRLNVVDSSGTAIARTCPETAATPFPFVSTFAPGAAQIEMTSLDLTCYAVKPGRDYSVKAIARVHVLPDAAGTPQTMVEVTSNAIEVGLPDTLSLTSCPAPNKPARVVKAVEPEYPLLARQESLVGVAVMAVILDEQGGIVDSFVYKSSGAKVLDDAGLVAARKSQYAPEVKNCVPVGGLYFFRAEWAYR